MSDRAAKIDVDYLGRQVDAGQVVDVDAGERDAPFVKAGLFGRAAARGRYVCRVCGGAFVSEAAREQHGRRRHARR